MIPWHDALSWLVDQLSADPRLSGVTVVSGAVDPDRAGSESLQFSTIRETAEWRVLGPGMLEAQAEVDATIWVARAGGGEEAIRAVRARADEIRTVLIETLFDAPTLGGHVRSAYVANATYDQGVDAAGMRVCRVTMTLRLSAYVRR